MSQPEDPIAIHLVPRPDSGFGGGAVASGRAAVTAAGPDASFEIHAAFAHDGPPIDRGETSDEEREAWVTAYTAGRTRARVVPGGVARVRGWGLPDRHAAVAGFQRHPADAAVAVRDQREDEGGAPRARARVRRSVHRPPAREPAVRGADGELPLRLRLRLERGARERTPARVRPDRSAHGRDADVVGGESVLLRGGGDRAENPEGETPGAEKECWISGMIADHGEGGEGRSSLAVLDGADLTKGPVARVWLEHRIPHGLHGRVRAQGGASQAKGEEIMKVAIHLY